MYNHPLIVFNPRRPKTFLPTMVAYNHHGCGHYDAVDYVDTSSISMIPTRQSDVGRHVGCTCGRGDKSVSPLHSEASQVYNHNPLSLLEGTEAVHH